MTFRRLTLGAITVGQLDGNGHPDVAIIYFYQPDGRFRCSATQVSNTVLRGGGGNCFGDSGGPVFHGGFLVADTSFGASQFCPARAATTASTRPDARGFLDDFIAVP